MTRTYQRYEKQIMFFFFFFCDSRPRCWLPWHTGLGTTRAAGLQLSSSRRIKIRPPDSSTPPKQPAGSTTAPSTAAPAPTPPPPHSYRQRRATGWRSPRRFWFPAPTRRLPVAITNTTDQVVDLVAFDAVPLPDAIRTLALQAGLNIEFDPKLLNPPPVNGQPVPIPTVTEKWHNVTAMQALTALLDNQDWELLWDAKSHIGRITARNPNALEPLVETGPAAPLQHAHQHHCRSQTHPFRSQRPYPGQPHSTVDYHDHRKGDASRRSAHRQTGHRHPRGADRSPPH